MKLIPYLVILVSLAGCQSNKPADYNLPPVSDSISATPISKTDWRFLKVQHDTLVFEDGHAFATNLHDLQYIGQIATSSSAPYLIFSGRDCTECDENISIYLHCPTNGALRVENGENRYAYPGTETAYETDSVVYTSRGFYGQVLDGVEGVIWYSNQAMDDGKTKRSVYLSRIVHSQHTDTSYTDNGTLEQTLRLLNRGLCHEIAGRTYSSEP